MLKKSKTKVLIPKKERLLTAQAYLLDIEQRQDIIKEVEFVPPKLGKAGFGSFRVRYDTPVLLPKGA
ncbi:hypothetical protein [Moraxella catarrhalis]|uniref:hypothetical protein n=1 Tax=Moraxella catarrhalis TaxID=480 RepID=UPI00128BD831|nr:hypothetical protein [Moraxella catarrhalis]MPW66523.1 hypothetical protein [Moraxella catarrhalis]MPW89891.1 hypothetical protein [Moraxella catarrhalis]